MPPVLHPANESEFVVTRTAPLYTEHVVGGYVFSDDHTVASLATRFDRLRAEKPQGYRIARVDRTDGVPVDAWRKSS